MTVEIQKQKIGIITLSASDNCGSLLQCYALKKLLEPYGNVEVINFSSEQSHKLYDIPKMKLKNLIRLLFRTKRGLKLIRLKKSKKDYQNFRINNLKMSAKELFREDLNTIKDKYDIIVAGSDQVWNNKMTDFDEAFFCGWTKSTKVAYAPSLGGQDIRNADAPDKLINLIKEFKHISAREEFGKNCLEKILGKNIEKVLDPTLAIDEKYWKELIGEPLIKGDYIFFYSWAYYNEDGLDIVKKESMRLNIPTIVIDARKWLKKDEKNFDFILSPEDGPIAFLNLMYYCKQAYVESFHGMIFAYLFKRNFYLLDSHEKLEDLDSRLAELVNLFAVQDRILTKYNYEQVNKSQPILYTKDNKNLDNLKTISNNFIKKIMED